MNDNGLNPRQEKFCLSYFSGMPVYQAYLDAGYSPQYATTAGSRLSKNVKIVARLAELQEAADSAKVMDVRERKERLSEIARAKLTDFQTAGADGSWIDIGPENPSAAALQEITSRTEYDDDGSHPSVITKVKVHNPMQAIAELNKMEHIYEVGAKVLIDNRTLEVTVVSPEGQSLLDKVKDGQGTEGSE